MHVVERMHDLRAIADLQRYREGLDAGKAPLRAWALAAWSGLAASALATLVATIVIELTPHARGVGYLFDFCTRIAAIFHSHWSEHDYVLLIVLVGPMVWILGGIGLWLRHPLGNFIVWFMLVGMILGEPTHLLVFPFLEGGRYHYVPGMWTALFPMIPAVYAVWRIRKDHRAAEAAEA
jgi:hypothetical protein